MKILLVLAACTTLSAITALQVQPGHTLLPATSENAGSAQAAAVTHGVCSELQNQIKGEVSCSPTQDNSFFQPECNKILPGWTVWPVDSTDVSKCIRIAQAFGVPLSYRSGGHSYTCNSIKEGSLHLDLRSMNHKKFWQGADGDWYLRFGPGNTFRDLYQIVDRNRFSFVHGECQSVGVGGFFLHGGVHLGGLSKLYGFGNESIVNMEVVVGNGTVLHIDDNQHPDLWFAMRIAGSSFGVVTDMTLRVFEVPEPRVWEIWLRSPDINLLSEVFVRTIDSPSVQFNIWPYNYKAPHILVQVSLLQGPAGRWQNLMQTLDWLKAQGLRVHPLWPIIWGILRVRMRFDIDYSPLYLWSTPFHHVGAILDASDVSVPQLFHRSRNEMCIFTINGVLFKGKGLIALDKTCFGKVPPAELDVPALHYKYINIPTRNISACLYFPQSRELVQVKRQWDPQNIFDVYQGISPDLEC